MTEAEFRQFAAQGFNRVPLVLETFADLETPLSVYLKLANRPNTYLLESVVGGERFGRYSFIGLATRTALRAVGRLVAVMKGDAVTEKSESADPLEFVRAFLARYRVAELPGLPRFAGGLVGYFGYDAVRWIEPRLATGWLKPDPVGCPDMLLLVSEELAVVDNLTGKLYLVVFADPNQPGAYQEARARLRELLGALRLPLDLARERTGALGEPRLNFERSRFCAAVARAREYIHEGDAMQVVLSQRMSLPFGGSPMSLYRALRAINPSPYMFYFDFGAFHVVGSSPEILVRLEGGAVTVRPIAGTRSRGRTRDEDLALERELLADPKEVAEHVMLVDLGRNDVGRVAQTGTVRVTEYLGIERYSHVMHIVSNVEGRARAELDAIAVLRAAFPAGTVSGAPKVRAMEIIDELEPERRGIYAGAVGYLGFSGDMDLAIAIRTAVVKDGLLEVQAGAGIVADSVPETEWQETQNKARAVLRAAEIALSGFEAFMEPSTRQVPTPQALPAAPVPE
ncbi:MAG: anthranilate synthase component I [Betaproteobacteria bacterium]|nr:anthranilate synthase component I [Betaproteobacteria bacterium]